MTATDAPLVTVAITAYERADLFRICLQSVCAQTYRNLEIFVFDNSDTDDVKNYVEELADNRIVYTRNSANVRDMIILNHIKAFIPKRGQYHFVLSSDWALRRDTFERMVKALATDPHICAVKADKCQIDLRSGKRTSREGKFAGYELLEVPGSHVRLDARRIIRDSFFSLSGVGVVYHALIVSDVLAHADLVRMYHSDASEHQLGLELLLQKPAFGFIRQELLEQYINDRRYRPRGFRKHSKFAEAAARRQFLEKNYLELLSKGFNTSLLRLGVAWLFARCMLQWNQRPFSSAYHFARITIPAIFALSLAPFYIPIAAVVGAVRRISEMFHRN